MTHPYIDDVLLALAEGQLSDADVLALGYERRAWLAYELPRESPPAVIAAYWRILEAMPPTPAAVQPRAAAAVEHHPWGSRGTRYDEVCEHCGRETELDNSTARCRRCHWEELRP